MEYKSTLNVTLSDKDPRAMPQRANLPAREPAIQAAWDAMDLYRLSLEKPAPRGSFILHDGPPYSNGDIHIGHALNKIAKDFIVKYATMAGFRAPYVPGWDNHGMPIENNVSREFRSRGERPDRVTMRRRCREYAAGWVETQKAQFKRLGVRGDWENPYLTMHTAFEARIIDVFRELAVQGYIYRGLKPVLWCPECETALADAEVEYGDHTSNSITVRFPVVEDPNGLFGGDLGDAYAVIWTTTPWTIPANLALAVHPDADYVVVSHAGARYLLAEPLAEGVLKAMGAEAPATVLATIKGEALVGMVARHPLFDRTSPVLLANYVTMEDGTGIVHTAPGHGKEDFETGQRNGLEVLCPVNGAGVLTQQAGEVFAGARILGGEADKRVIAALDERGALLARGAIEHKYPHCWRCHQPLLFRATVQWFMNIDNQGHRERSLEAIDGVTWYPPSSKNRITSMVGGRPDWCLSRQRAWGVGIPAFYCSDCGAEMLEDAAIAAVRDIVAAEGSDAWYIHSAAEILPEGTRCKGCGGSNFEKETDILDVWFDSGSTHLAVLDSGRWPDLSWPADLYMEGSDQHRGWFNSSLMIGVGVRNSAPYRGVITHGWTLDENGKAMHKSLGNVVPPAKVVEKSGADILRLWAASTDYFEDVRCSEAIIDRVAEVYRRIRNTLRFLVNNLYDFDPVADAVPEEQMVALDRWALAQLARTATACAAGYESYEFHKVFHSVHNFCAVELSAFYLDVIKDRLYCSGATSHARRSAQTALYALADGLARLVAPILSHTAEEVWQLMRGEGRPASVQLADFPAGENEATREVVLQWEPFMALREQVSLAVEQARAEKVVGNPLESVVEIRRDAATCAALEPFVAELPALLKVSQATLVAADEASVLVRPAPGVKCARCWLIKEEVGTLPEHADLCHRCADVVAAIPLGA